MQNFIEPLRDLLVHQVDLQLKLANKCRPEENPQNIAHSWTSTHFGINSLDNCIEECIEAKRHIKARKWWANHESIADSHIQIRTMTELRRLFIEELADIFICWLNVLVYFSVGPQEFVDILEAKLDKNNPENPKSDIGNRS